MSYTRYVKNPISVLKAFSLVPNKSFFQFTVFLFTLTLDMIRNRLFTETSGKHMFCNLSIDDVYLGFASGNISGLRITEHVVSLGPNKF